MAFKASSDSPCYCVVGLSRSASDTAEISLRRILGTLFTTAVKGGRGSGEGCGCGGVSLGALRGLSGLFFFRFAYKVRGNAKKHDVSGMLDG